MAKFSRPANNCVERFLSRYDTIVEAAAALENVTGRSCAKQSVNSWRKHGYIPWTFALAVEQLTKYEITLHEIISEGTRNLKRDRI